MRKMEDREGIEPILDSGLKGRRQTQPATGPRWSTHEVLPLVLSVIGRLHILHALRG